MPVSARECSLRTVSITPPTCVNMCGHMWRTTLPTPGAKLNPQGLFMGGGFFFKKVSLARTHMVGDVFISC